MHNNQVPFSSNQQDSTTAIHVDTATNDQPNTNIDTYSLTIMTDRNRALAATVYRPKQAVKTAVMIAPATGIKRQFYNNFASFLAKNGFGVLTFDNEGIGESLTTDLAKCDATLISWGRHDMPAVLDALQDEFADATYHLIGHSAGGQLIGFSGADSSEASANTPANATYLALLSIIFVAQLIINSSSCPNLVSAIMALARISSS